MAKVFTITEGLENMGAIKTGGQGSVYKGRRLQAVTTAIKLLPTPISSENEEDKNYLDFQNEVQKLKRVNEHHNPHVVTILSSGITESGNLPYIEMDFIDGPDLSELLHPPHQKVFTINEVIKVATQLSSALAHCHKLEVKHGDIKSNNIKFNNQTGNYVLLDFGLSIMSHEQRRTSLRHAGAIEFMAPEQNEGELLFQTDIYSFGIVIYELLTGNVPFPLRDKGESARNTVRLSHMEQIPPDVQQQRELAVSATEWSATQQKLEIAIPAWLLALVKKCLEKLPGNRFANGKELNDFIITNSLEKRVEEAKVLPDLVLENRQLKQQLTDYKQLVNSKENDLEELKLILRRRQDETVNGSWAVINNEQVTKKRSPLGIVLLTALLAIVFGAFATYSFMNRSAGKNIFAAESDTVTDNTLLPDDTFQQVSNSNKVPANAKATTSQTTKIKRNDSIVSAEKIAAQTGEIMKPESTTEEKQSSLPDSVATNPQQELPVQTQPAPKPKSVGLYTVNDKAFFHNEPNNKTRRNAFINHWNNAILAALNEENGFIYVVYTNKEGQTSKGWLLKSDLRRINP